MDLGKVTAYREALHFSTNSGLDSVGRLPKWPLQWIFCVARTTRVVRATAPIHFGDYKMNGARFAEKAVHLGAL
jgi:hypothetical protein